MITYSVCCYISIDIVYNLDLTMLCYGMFVVANLCFLTSLHKPCIGKLQKNNMYAHLFNVLLTFCALIGARNVHLTQ